MFDWNGPVTQRRVGTGNPPHDLAYEYDAGGNRTRKVDALNQREVAYHYDLEDPLRFASANNRLEYAEEFGWVGGVYDLTATTWYYHAHNVTRVVRHEEGTDVYTALRLGYARNERTVTFAAGERWHWDGNPAHAETGYELTWVRQFRYDSGRSRYLSRKLDPVALQAGQLVVLEDVWSDYSGDDVYADYSVTAGVARTTRAYEPGLATVEDPTAAVGPPRSEYYVTDHLGTTRDRSYLGTPQARAVYTAFGERVLGPTPPERFGYVGAWGYQQPADSPFLHVGARYYDPSSGRFLQRDPIGIVGGQNVYAYVGNLPTVRVDPTGLWVIQGGIGGSTTIPNVGPLLPGGASSCLLLDVSLYFDDRGYFRLGVTAGIGAGIGGYVGGGAIGGLYSGTVDDMSGPSAEVGLDTPTWSGAGVAGNGYAGAQGSIGPGFGGSIRGSANYTWATRPIPFPIVGPILFPFSGF